VDLRSGKSVWVAEAAQSAPRADQNYHPLARDLACQVAVLGAGVTGSLVALELVGRGFEVTVFDRAAPGRGSTAASTALLLRETDTSFRDLAGEIGTAGARAVWNLGDRAIERIEAVCRGLPDRCGFERLPSYYLASSGRAARELRREFDARRAAGLAVEWLDGDDLRAISSLPHPAALRSAAAIVDPLCLANGALAAAHRSGARVHAETDIVRFVAGERQGGVRLATARGHEVVAEHLIVASGYEAARFLELSGDRLRSSYAVATPCAARPLAGYPGRAVIWETARPYLYVRPAAGGRLVAGGADTAFAGDHRAGRRLERRTEKVLRRLAEWFPAVEPVAEYRWAGVFGESRDGLPYIGPVPGRSGVYAALGFGGNGITFAAIAAELLADVLQGERPSALAPFAPER
jgi:glycine/D-amino acid oxidase-like deaminating enzyme